MDYASAVQLAISRRAAKFSLQEFLEARALDLVAPGALEVNARGHFVGPDGPLLGAPMAELALTAMVPGSVIIAPKEPAAGNFAFLPENVPHQLKVPFSLSSTLVAVIGLRHVEFLEAIRDLWGRMEASGAALPAEAARARSVIDAGLAVVPVTPDSLRRGFPDQADELLAPLKSDKRINAWVLAAAMFAKPMELWTDGLFADAKRVAAAGARNEAAWDKIAAVVKAVADAPAAVAREAGRLVDDAAAEATKGLGLRGMVVLAGLAVLALGGIFGFARLRKGAAKAVGASS